MLRLRTVLFPLLLAAFILITVLPISAQIGVTETVPTPGTREIFRVLAYGDAIFSDAWYVDASQNNFDRSTAAWYNDSYGALVYYSLLHYPEVTADLLPDYFTPDYMANVLTNYTPYQLTATCSADGITLMTYDATNNAEAYIVYYYYQIVEPATARLGTRTSDRVLTIQLSFPKDQVDALLATAAAVMPALPSC